MHYVRIMKSSADYDTVVIDCWLLVFNAQAVTDHIGRVVV